VEEQSKLDGALDLTKSRLHVFINIYVFLLEIIISKEIKKKKYLDDFYQFEGVHYMTNIFNTLMEKKLPEPYYFISPSNSNGSMLGGLDLAYLRMDYQLEDKLKKKIHDTSSFTSPYSDNKILPVGASVIVPFMKNSFIISSPTMEKQGTDVSNTNNAYRSMIASLTMMEHRFKNEGTLWVPGLCTNVGKMGYDKSSDQVLQAFKDSKEKKYPSGIASVDSFMYFNEY